MWSTITGTMGKDICVLCCCLLSATCLQVCCCKRATILEVKSGAPFGIFDIYTDSTLSGYVNGEYQGVIYPQYKSEIVNNWSRSNIQQVIINIYKGGNRTAFFVFDGNGTDSKNWMSKSRLLRTSYTDLNESSAEYVQISFQDIYVSRRFYISAPHAGCHRDTGWLVLVESRRQDRCVVDNVTSTTIWFSDLETKKKFDDFQKADEMTVEVEMDVTCDVNDLHVENTTDNKTGYKYNDTVTYQCVEGFQHTSGDLIRRCIETNTWSGRRPVCLDVTCDVNDLHVENTTYNMTGYKYNDTVTYQCVEGFQHTSGDLIRRCIGINTWSGRRPVCLGCHCKCKTGVYIQPNDTKAIEASVKKIKSELSIKSNETSKAQRRKKSAPDDRASAKVVGSVLGGTLLAGLVLLIVVSDAKALLNSMKMGCDNVKSRNQFKGGK